MNKRLLVLTGILSVLSVNVMGAPVNVGTDTITIGVCHQMGIALMVLLFLSKQFWINDEFQMVVMNVSLLNRARYLCRITILVWILMTMD